MARSIKRASQATVDTVHRLVGKELARQLRAAAKDKTEGVSAALLGQAIAFLKLTDTTNPERPKRKDTLRAAMPDFDELEAGTGRAPQVAAGDPYANLGTARE